MIEMYMTAVCKSTVYINAVYMTAAYMAALFVAEVPTLFYTECT